MNILVTGANGQLGNHMRLVAAELSGCDLIFTDVNETSAEQIAVLSKLVSADRGNSLLQAAVRSVCEIRESQNASVVCESREVREVNTSTEYLDITDLDAVRSIVRERGISVIVNCAAYTNVDAAENNYELAELLNSKSAGNLATAMKEIGGLLVHISTDYVFGKEPYNVPCREDQKGTPTGVYGLTKLHGEQQILGSGCKYVILRTAWLYSEFGKNFCKTMLNLLKSKSELKVVFDQTGTPTYAGDLAAAISVILKDYAAETGENYSKSGIYNYSNEGVCSWFDFTKMIQRIAVGMAGSAAIDDCANGANQNIGKCAGEHYRNCNVQPCHSCEFPSPVARPAYSVLDKTKVKEAFGISVPYWVDSLDKCLANLLR